MNIILFGFPASGKSTLGRKLAEQLQFSFVDTDRYIEQFYPGHTVRQIVQHFGFDVFRTLETETLEALADVDKHVIAVGGGTVLDPENLKLLNNLGKCVYLTVEKEKLKKRLLSGELPLYLDEEDPAGSFEEMYAERKKVYESIPAILVDPNKEETVAELVEMIRGK
jgi:shikimate kinase